MKPAKKLTEIEVCTKHKAEEEVYGPEWPSVICLRCMYDKVDLVFTKLFDKKSGKW